MADGNQAHNRRRVDPLPGPAQGPTSRPQQEVLSNRDLLIRICFVLAQRTRRGGGVPLRTLLLHFSLVCREWKAFSRQNYFWEAYCRGTFACDRQSRQSSCGSHGRQHFYMHGGLWEGAS